jgi:hypothetical protein
VLSGQVGPSLVGGQELWAVWVFPLGRVYGELSRQVCVEAVEAGRLDRGPLGAVWTEHFQGCGLFFYFCGRR